MPDDMMRKTPAVLRIDPAAAVMEPLALDGAYFQSPLPVQKYHLFFEDEAIGLAVGIWDTTTMQEAFGPYPGDEFIVVLEGSFAMVDGMGGAVAGAKGQSVCFRNAIPTSWKQDGYLKKIYLTLNEPDLAPPVIASAAGGVIAVDPAPLAKGSPEQMIFANDRSTMTVHARWMAAAEMPMAASRAHQLVRVLQGQVTISGPDGQAQVFADGDVFFVPFGTVCAWRIDRPLSLHQVSVTVPDRT
jgi:uncharacterized cupin superfamily protein